MSAYPIVYFEISAQDAARSAKFYAELFGWKTDVDPNMDYHQFTAAGGPGGGFPKVDGKTYKLGDVVAYLAAADIDAMLKKIVAHGG